MRSILCSEIREFNRMYKEIDDLYHEVSLHSGLSNSAHLILYSIAELGDGCLQIEIANTYSISKQTVSSSIRLLEKQGYIYLTHGKKRDMHLHFTEKGTQFAKEHIFPLMQVENSVFDAMSPGEVRELLRLTRMYADIMKDKMQQLLR